MRTLAETADASFSIFNKYLDENVDFPVKKPGGGMNELFIKAAIAFFIPGTPVKIRSGDI